MPLTLPHLFDHPADVKAIYAEIIDNFEITTHYLGNSPDGIVIQLPVQDNAARPVGALLLFLDPTVVGTSITIDISLSRRAGTWNSPKDRRSDPLFVGLAEQVKAVIERLPAPEGKVTSTESSDPQPPPGFRAVYLPVSLCEDLITYYKLKEADLTEEQIADELHVVPGALRRWKTQWLADIGKFLSQT